MRCAGKSRMVSSAAGADIKRIRQKICNGRGVQGPGEGRGPQVMPCNTFIKRREPTLIERIGSFAVAYSVLLRVELQRTDTRLRSSFRIYRFKEEIECM